jgi:S1-C subfamily serine protease
VLKRYTCPACRTNYTADEHGGAVACPGCGRRLAAPVPAPRSGPAPAPADPGPPPMPRWSVREPAVRVVATKPVPAVSRGLIVASVLALGFVVLVVIGGVAVLLAVRAKRSGTDTVAERPTTDAPPTTPAASNTPITPIKPVGPAAPATTPTTTTPARPGPAPVPVELQPMTAEQLHPRLVRSAVLVDNGKGFGSGFVVSLDARLIVTNYHVVGTATKVDVICPLYDGDDAVTDLRRYKGHRELLIPGTVIDRDTARDLALVKVDHLPDRARAIPLARKPAATGALVYSVGGSGAEDNLLWRLTRGIVRGRVQRQQRADFGLIDCMILETDAPVNPGDSGGAVVNDRGSLVAVVSHGSTVQRQVSGNIDVDEVRAFLGRHLGER